MGVVETHNKPTTIKIIKIIYIRANRVGFALFLYLYRAGPLWVGAFDCGI